MTPVTDGAWDRVVVVGAGPVGLTAALALRARDIPVTVLEADPADRVRPGSRAIFVHRASLALLERHCPGLGGRTAGHGLVWPTKRTLFRGREVYRRTYPPVPEGTLPPLTSLPQVELERFLLDACADAGVDLVFDAPVRGVDVGRQGVAVTDAGGARREAAYVVGADGARSVVRGAIGARLEGERSRTAFVIVDVADDPDHPLPPERVFHYEHPAVDGRNVLLVPFRGGWRVDLQCRPGDDVDAFSSPDGVRAWVARVLPAAVAERVTWVSTYRFQQVVADRFVDAGRRVLLAGEAAHLFAPFGARGMNSGMADAAAAAAAIQQALGATTALLADHVVDTFARERGAAAAWNRDAAGRALAHLEASDSWTRARRRLAAAATPLTGRAGRWLDAAPYGPRVRPGYSEVTY